MGPAPAAPPPPPPPSFSAVTELLGRGLPEPFFSSFFIEAPHSADTVRQADLEAIYADLAKRFPNKNQTIPPFFKKNIHTSVGRWIHRIRRADSKQKKEHPKRGKISFSLFFPFPRAYLAEVCWHL